MADEIIRLDDGQLARMERGADKAERAERALTRTSANVEKIGRDLARRVDAAVNVASRAISMTNKVADFFGAPADVRRGLSRAEDISAGAAAGADFAAPLGDLAGAIPIVGGALRLGIKVAGTAAGGRLADKLNEMREERRNTGLRETQLRANEQFHFEEGLRREREAAEAKWEALERDNAGSLGGGSAAAAAAMRRARGSARR